ncbi:hypothetical protein HH212_19985 [Massilia forsythiae]|uniref:Glycoside hydrolase family 19 catalytic domain-containing protein n=1 Tax=Massilia forsythiae TaxID=2728020 RepID=A0A7Z2W023_9BURK|nr:hypothetical protein [Massilia forsythiae]QJE02017.1 hypothetical protein HH212_19985 [Massilia forsythiae]
MTTWEDFLKVFKKLSEPSKPGSVMIRFITRYMEPADGIAYLIQYEGKEIRGTTTTTDNHVLVSPASLHPIRVHAWSRKRKGFKLIDTLTPVVGTPQLVYETMKTYKQPGATKPHPKSAGQAGSAPAAPPRSVPPGPSPTDNQGVTPKPDQDSSKAPLARSERPLPDEITYSQLKNIFPLAEEAYLTQVKDELNRDLPRYKLDTIYRRAHFFAQAREEAGAGLKANVESLNYKVDTLKSTFRYYRLHPDVAARHGRIDRLEGRRRVVLQPANQEAIANHAYGSRAGNGPPETGEGWKYRGRGIFQLTGASNYAEFNTGYRSLWDGEHPDFTSQPEKIVDFPFNIRSAVWFWVANKVYERADQGASDNAVEKVTEKINPALKHLDMRQHNFRTLTYPAFK